MASLQSDLLELVATSRVLQEFAVVVQERYKDAVRSGGSNASGLFINSIQSKVTIRGNTYLVTLNLEDYWKYLEYGRKPGRFPPVDKIRQWIRIKPIIALPSETGKLPTQNQLAYLIGRKIATKGIPAKHYLQNTMDEVIAEFEQRIIAAFDEDVKNLVYLSINSLSSYKFKHIRRA